MPKQKFWMLLMALCCNSIHPASASKPFAPRAIERVKKSVVTIHVNSSFSAYEKETQWSGTGFIANKAQGLILTNEHVIGTAAVGSYEVTFCNGTRATARPLYKDPWYDYGFLRVNPEEIPEEATETRLSKNNPKADQPIFMVGNNGGLSFSLHTGVVADCYCIEGKLPQHSVKLSLSTMGGSSGSPIVNRQGEAVGLNYAGNQTFAFALHPEYVRHALKSIQAGKSPKRKQVGILTQTASIGDLVHYHGLPDATQRTYSQKFPDAPNTGVQVSTVLPGSPADGLIFPGDFVSAVDGREIGPNLVDLDMAMNQTQKEHVVLTLFRNGLWHDVTVRLYNLEDHSIRKMVHFGGAMFFEMDDYFSALTVMPAKTLVAVLTPHSIFNDANVARIKIMELNGQPVSNLEALVAAIPSLMAKKKFTMHYMGLSHFYGYDQARYAAHGTFQANVEYSAAAPEPRLFLLDSATNQWTSKQLGADAAA